MGTATIVLVGPARFSARPPFAGGLECFVGSLADGLRRRGHRVIVVAGVRAGRHEDPVGGHRTRTDVPSDPVAARADGLALRAAVQRLIETHDVHVVHNNSFSPEVLELAEQVPHFETTLHTPPLSELTAALRSRPDVGLSTPSTSNALRWAVALGRPPDVVVNGVDRTLFRPRRRRRPYLAWVGRIVPEKGLHLAIDAASLLEVPIRCAGPIHDRGYYDEVIAPRLGPNATYEGHLGPDGMSALLGGAITTLVTPLWPEPFGLVVIESLACGTPVAGFANGALRAGRDGAFPSHVVATTGDISAAGLAEAAVRTASVPRSWCRRASEPFDLEGVVSAYERRYSTALAPAV